MILNELFNSRHECMYINYIYDIILITFLYKIMNESKINLEKKVTILLNVLSVLCELAERDATFFLPQKGNEIDYEESVRYLIREIQITSRRNEE